MKKVKRYYYIIPVIWLLITVLNISLNAAPSRAEIPRDEWITDLTGKKVLYSGWLYIAGDNDAYADFNWDDSSWTSMDLPRNNLSIDSNRGNHLWFRKYFYVSPELEGQPFSYSAGKLPDTAEIYLNGSFIGRHGTMPPDHYYGNSTIPRTFVFSDGLIRYGGVNVVAMRVYSEHGSVNLLAPFISRESSHISSILSLEYLFNIAMPEITVFTCIIVAIFFLIMFLRGRGEKYTIYIFFTHIAIMIFSLILSAEQLPFELMLMTKIQYSSLFWACLFTIYYIQDFFQIHTKQWLKNVLAIVVGLVCIGIFSAHSLEQTIFRLYSIFYLFVLIPGFIYLQFLTILAIRRKMKYAGILLSGIAIVMLFAFHDIYYVSIIKSEPPFWLFSTGMFFFILSLLITAAYRFVDSRKEVDELNIELIQQKNAFFRFVPTQFLSLLGKKSAVDLDPEDSSQLSMSILFSDIKKFTSNSRDMDPEESFRLLNKFLLKLETSIMQNDGFLDKYIGDTVMALFSEVPGTDEEKSSADRAINAAIQMRLQLEEFDSTQRPQAQYQQPMGIGINTGPLMLGTVKSANRMDTTVLGDTVSLASRLEGLSRSFEAGIVITEFTLELISHPERLFIRELDSVYARGKLEPVILYEIFNTDPLQLRQQKQTTLETYQKALFHYKTRQFKTALKILKELNQQVPGDKPTRIYIERCQDYLKTPPPLDWKGVFRGLGD